MNSKFNWIKLGIVILVLLLQSGCQQQVVATDAQKTEQPPAVGVQTPRTVQPAGQTDPNTPEPRITFESTVHDFGNVKPKSNNLCEFRFKNTGDSLLTITDITKTCGCTPFTLEKKEYAPGESGILKVKYNAGRQKGSVIRRLYVSSNDTSRSRVELVVKATIVLKVDWTPKKLDLSLRKENAGCPPITIISLDGQPFSIKSFKSKSNCVTADVNSAEIGTELVIHPKIDIDKLRKSLRGQITIELTHPETDTVILRFEALPEYKITPATIITFNAEPLKPVKRQIWILSNYDEDFEVLSASSKNGTIKILDQQKVGKRHRFDIEVIPPPISGEKNLFSDIFSIQIKNGQKLDISCRGFYKKNK